MAKAKAKETPKVKLTLIKSANGRIAKHRATAEALGLRRIGDATIQPDNAATRGKIAAIGYLLAVEAQDEGGHK